MGFLSKNNICRGCLYFDVDDQTCECFGDGFVAPLRVQAAGKCMHRLTFGDLVQQYNDDRSNKKRD